MVERTETMHVCGERRGRRNYKEREDTRRERERKWEGGRREEEREGGRERGGIKWRKDRMRDMIIIGE